LDGLLQEALEVAQDGDEALKTWYEGLGADERALFDAQLCGALEDMRTAWQAWANILRRVLDAAKVRVRAADNLKRLLEVER